LLTGPTPEAVKRAAAALRLDGPLRGVKARLRSAQDGAQLQFGFWVAGLPSRRARHAGYRRLGLQLAADAPIHRGLELRAPRSIRIGVGTVVGFDATLDGRCGITIGDHVNLSSEVAIWTLQHDHRDPKFGSHGGPVTVGDRAWLSFRATVLPGVSIGPGAIVAAGAVVTHDVPPYTIVAGVPARVIGRREE